MHTSARAGVDHIRAWLDPGLRQNRDLEVRLTFDELALIDKSLEAIKTLRLLPPQDDLLVDTIQVVDQRLNTFAR